MTCFTRPADVVCHCGRRVTVSPIGPIPSRCYECVNAKLHVARATSVACKDCGKQVAVSPRGGTRLRCDECREKKAKDARLKHRAELREGKRTPRPREDPREIGPERPLLGMTPGEHRAWRDKRIVELYQAEELTAGALAERFGISDAEVTRTLNAAGLRARDGGRSRLPAGLPCL